MHDQLGHIKKTLFIAHKQLRTVVTYLTNLGIYVFYENFNLPQLYNSFTVCDVEIQIQRVWHSKDFKGILFNNSDILKHA